MAGGICCCSAKDWLDGGKIYCSFLEAPISPILHFHHNFQLLIPKRIHKITGIIRARIARISAPSRMNRFRKKEKISV
jgi:hypothetical protein